MMTKHILGKRYYTIGRNSPCIQVEVITIDFKSDYAYLIQRQNAISLNRTAQLKLYNLLKKKFEKKKDKRD